MTNEQYLLSAIAVPVIGSPLVILLGWFSKRLRNWASFIAVFASFISSCALLPIVLSGRLITVSLELPLGFNCVLTADMLAVFMAIVSSLIGTIIVLYSFGYISHYPNQNEYYFMVVLFLGSMTGLVYSANLIFLYIFWEITALASWRLIGFFREKEYVWRADKAFMVTVAGALLMLIGFILIYEKTGSFDLAVIKEAFRSEPLPQLAVILILIGILTKSATLPFHTWLPDAGVAPSPVTALLHAAVLVKIGVYVFARLFIATFTLSSVWHTALPVIAATSALVAAGAALVETDMKRIIAYSTVSQIAFIFLGFSIGTEIGVIGALLYILMHGLAKGGLFLCAGIVEQNTKTKDIRKMGGLITTMPVTAISFLACAFSVMGLPPFGGFFSKYLVFSGAIASGHIYITFVFLAGAVLTLMYLVRIFNSIFLGNESVRAKEGSRIMVASVAALAVLSLLGGIFIKYLSEFAQATAAQMIGKV